ncbi:SMAD/FHA domain-containing protein [Ramaria rubella]|nr:SMAD/FHA domain-containing protein [Ramaria rubella]
MDSPTSDTPRQSLLGSINFLARSNRPRAATTSHNSTNPTDSPAVPPINQLPSSTSTPGHRRRPAAVSNVSTPQIPTANSSALGYMLRRRRSSTAIVDRPEQRAQVPSGPTHRIRLVPHLETHRSLHFEAISRDLRQGDSPLRIGRFTDRSSHSATNGNKLAFKSKVVSRGHAEVWFDSGSFYVKDTKSSSGTFLNHIRLSAPNTESRPHPIKDGDVLQLGVDYQGGTEEIYRCVKMRIELGREWQSGVNTFNSNALLQLKTLSGAVQPDGKSGPADKRVKSSMTDCCICLFQVTVCQALFIAPCSHVYHYKCIRPLLEMHHPGFSCPLCRTFADLEADVEVENREPESIPEDVVMAVEEVGEASAARKIDAEGGHDIDAEDVEDVEDADRTSSISSTGAPIEADAAAPIPIPRTDSQPGFPGAEATPLNTTFLATLARSVEDEESNMARVASGTNAVMSGAGTGGPALSDDGESGEGTGDDNAGGVGAKRKR